MNVTFNGHLWFIEQDLGDGVVHQVALNPDDFDALARNSEDYKRLKADYESACQTIAAMHAAAVGEVRGPKVGVVEDVAALRAALTHIQEMAEEDLRVDGHGAYLFQIEADARAALA